MTLRVTPGRGAGHRPAALPRRLRPPRGDPTRQPGLSARPPGGRSARPRGRRSRSSSASPACTGCSSTSSTRDGSGPPPSRCGSAADGEAAMSTERRPPSRAGHLRDDLRLLREPDRAQAQQARRGHRQRQLRDREGRGQPTAARSATTGWSRSSRRRGTASSPRRPPDEPATARGGAVRRSPAAAGRQRPAERPGDRDGDDPGAAVRLLAVGVADPGRAGRRVGRAAVPPRRVGQPAARHDHDGHARLRGHARGVRLVALRAVPRHRGDAGDDPPVRPHAASGWTAPATSTSRRPRASRRSCWPGATSRTGQAPRRGRPAITDGARRQGRGGAAR